MRPTSRRKIKVSWNKGPDVFIELGNTVYVSRISEGRILEEKWEAHRRNIFISWKEVNSGSGSGKRKSFATCDLGGIVPWATAFVIVAWRMQSCYEVMRVRGEIVNDPARNPKDLTKIAERIAKQASTLPWEVVLVIANLPSMSSVIAQPAFEKESFIYPPRAVL